MMIEFHFIDVEVPDFNSELFVLGINNLINSEDRVCGDLNVIFCSDEYLLEVNKLHLDHDYYTDIITFDYCFDSTVSGDLFISVERVKDNSSALKVAFMLELSRVCAHGVLHLCGYGDKSEDEVAVMRTKEEFYIPFFCST